MWILPLSWFFFLCSSIKATPPPLHGTTGAAPPPPHTGTTPRPTHISVPVLGGGGVIWVATVALLNSVLCVGLPPCLSQEPRRSRSGGSVRNQTQMCSTTTEATHTQAQTQACGHAHTHTHTRRIRGGSQETLILVVGPSPSQ